MRVFLNKVLNASVFGVVLIMLCSFEKSAGPDTNAKIKAIFLYNFSKYVEWPDDMSHGNFKIGILGDYPELITELKSMARVKKRGNRSFDINTVKLFDDLTNNHILFVEQSRNVDFAEIMKYTKGSSTLIVTESSEFINSGSCINLFYENSKQRIEMNPETIKGKKLKVSSKLRAIAKIIN